MGRFKSDGDLEVTFFVRPNAALALAQLLKRLDYDAIKRFTQDEVELELARTGLSDLAAGLEEAGIAPR